MRLLQGGGVNPRPPAPSAFLIHISLTLENGVKTPQAR